MSDPDDSEMATDYLNELGKHLIGRGLHASMVAHQIRSVLEGGCLDDPALIGRPVLEVWRLDDPVRFGRVTVQPDPGSDHWIYWWIWGERIGAADTPDDTDADDVADTVCADLGFTSQELAA